MIKKFIRSILSKNKKKDPTQPTVIPAQKHGIDPALVSPNAVRVTSTLQQAGFEAFIVGGAVRDLLLGIKPKDFDVATNATPEQVKRLFRRAMIIGRRFQIVHVMFGQDLIEVTTFRGNSAQSAVSDEHGRVLRDNTFGAQHEDAARRDFTINAMYYDPATQNVLDYHEGIADIRTRTLRIIGEPAARFREDPVRMLRIARFAAKLQFTIEPATREPIQSMAELINNVPAARLFDEMLKLLLSGHALACLQQLRQNGLHHGLLPLLDVVLEQPSGEKFVTLALNNTDQRVRDGKPVSPGFLFASMLWQQVLEKWQALQNQGVLAIPALHQAADEVFDAQTEKLALQRRITADMRDIWAMQPRFDRRTGKAPYRLIEHPRIRAGYDFLLLRCDSGEAAAELGQWWTAFMDGDTVARNALIEQATVITAAASVAGTKTKKKKTARPKFTEAGDVNADKTRQHDHAVSEADRDDSDEEGDSHPEEDDGLLAAEQSQSKPRRRRRRRAPRKNTTGEAPVA